MRKVTEFSQKVKCQGVNSALIKVSWVVGTDIGQKRLRPLHNPTKILCLHQKLETTWYYGMPKGVKKHTGSYK